jgi:hypothetical protein
MLAGCHVDLSGLNQLFSSDPTYLSLPGKRIGSGSFSLVSIVGTNASGAHVVAFDASSSPGVLRIFPFSGGKGCSTGPSTLAYPASLDFGVRSDIPPILGFHEKTNSATLLHLTTLDCKETLPPIADRSYPFDATFDPPGYLTLDASGELAFLEPWNGKKRVVADQVRGTRNSQDRIWSIEGGELVARDLSLKVFARYGKNVIEFDTVGDSPTRAVYLEGTCAAGASPCEGDVFLVADAPGAAKKIDSNACNVLFPARWAGHGVSYRSPCADRRLVVYGATKASAGDQSQSRFVVGDAVLGSPDVDFMHDTAYVFYAKADDPKSGGTLMGGVLGEPLETIGDRPTRNSSQGAPIVDKSGSSWRATIEFDSQKNAGRLITWKPGAELTEVATGITQITGPVAIVDYDGSVGNLVQLSGGTISPPLARRVPRQRILSSSAGIALIADYDGDRGTLLVAQADTTDFEPVAKGVTLAELGGDIAFLQSLTAIAYLHDYDEKSGTGVLGARLLETGDNFDIGIRASEWSEVGWPEPGILYVAPEGDAAGIWFARLR